MTTTAPPAPTLSPAKVAAQRARISALIAKHRTRIERIDGLVPSLRENAARLGGRVEAAAARRAASVLGFVEQHLSPAGELHEARLGANLTCLHDSAAESDRRMRNVVVEAIEAARVERARLVELVVTAEAELAAMGQP